MKMSLRASLVVLSCSVLAGCGYSSIVSKRFAYDYGCKKEIAVRKVSGSTFEASGCDEVATYTCAGKDVCVREEAPASPGSAHAGSAPAQPRSRVERKYDAERKLQTVRGVFSTAANTSIIFVGEPATAPGEVLIQMNIPRSIVHQTCQAVEVLVNDVPAAGERFESKYEGGFHQSRARHDFQTFKPLAQQYSTLAVRACGYQITMDEASMDDVKKFFVIYSQLAAEVAPEAQPASDTASGEPATEL
jgi:hypothetical protein